MNCRISFLCGTKNPFRQLNLPFSKIEYAVRKTEKHTIHRILLQDEATARWPKSATF